MCQGLIWARPAGWTLFASAETPSERVAQACFASVWCCCCMVFVLQCTREIWTARYDDLILHHPAVPRACSPLMQASGMFDWRTILQLLVDTVDMGCLPRMPKCCPKLCSLQRGRSHHSHRFFKSGRGLQLQCSFRCQVCGCLLPKNESHEQTYIYISRRSFLTAENRSMFSCESVLEIWKCSKNPRFYSQVGYMSIHLIPKYSNYV